MKYILGGVEVDEPVGLEGIYFEKAKSNRFFSILSNSVGRVRGVGEVSFEEPTAVQLLEAAKETDGIGATVTFEMIDNTNTTLIDSEVDMINYRRRPNWWSVTFRDSGQLSALELQAETMVSITPNLEVTLEPVALAQEITHYIAENLNAVTWKVSATTRALSHYPAFEALMTRADETGDFASVTNPFKEQAVWINTTPNARTIEVSARFKVAQRSATSATGLLVLYVVNGNNVTTYPIVDVVVGTSLETKTYTINEVITVPQNAELYLKMDDFSADSADFEFTYDVAESYLSINADKAVASSTAKVVTCFDALRLIAAQIAPTVTITNEVAALDADWITNGKQLRGNRAATLMVSFGMIWDELNKIYNLVLVRTGTNSVVIRTKADYLSQLGDGVDMQSVSMYELNPVPELLYGRVNVGFLQWQSNTPSGNEESYGNEYYSTGLPRVAESLDLICTTLSASSKLMEVVRRKQFDTGGSSSSNDGDYDEDLFIKGSAITPNDMLSNWECFWAVNASQLVKTTGTPDSTARSVTGESVFFTGEAVVLQGVLSGEQWAQLEDVLTFYDGGLRYRVLISESSYRPGAAGSGADDNTMILGWVIK